MAGTPIEFIPEKRTSMRACNLATVYKSAVGHDSYFSTENEAWPSKSVLVMLITILAGCSQGHPAPPLEHSPQTTKALEQRIAETDW
jgi:hypothetical protein